MFRRRLERKGYEVLTAGTGRVAVELTKTGKPDLVLMDLALPELDGWEATRRIKADPATKNIPVIVLSAHATADAKERAFAAGCQEFETKPVNWEVLFKKIEAALAATKSEEAVDLGGHPAVTGSATDMLRNGPPAATADGPPPANSAPRTSLPSPQRGEGLKTPLPGVAGGDKPHAPSREKSPSASSAGEGLAAPLPNAPGSPPPP